MVSDDEDKPVYASVVLGSLNPDEQSTGRCIDSKPQSNTNSNEDKDNVCAVKDEEGEELHVSVVVDNIEKPLNRCSRLYGREKEQQKLLEAYRLSQSFTTRTTESARSVVCCSTKTTTESARSVVCIIKGSAGSGKTALANSLKEHLRMENGTMIPWVCDRQAVLQIGPGFTVALRKWVNDMLLLSDEALAKWKQQVMKQFDSIELAMFVKHFPGLGQLFKVEDFPTVLHQEYRYDWSTFQKFLQASSTSEFPLVFVVDDYHWVELTSFRWIFDRMDVAGNEGSFFIISYDSDKEDKESPWYQELQGLPSKGFEVVEIFLQNLDEDATTSIVSDVLEVPSESVQHISRWVHGQTMGNPLYVEELLHDLCARAILTPNGDRSWTFQEDAALDHCGGCTTVCEYLTKRLCEVPGRTLEVLKVAACLGLRFKTKLVSSALSSSAAPHLEMAEQAGVLTLHDLDKGSKSSSSEQSAGPPKTWQFVHNCMHEAMLRVVGGREEQEHLHMTVGRMLIINLGDTELKDDLLTVMGQVIKGASFIKDMEKTRIAQFALEAARKAVDLSSFESAKTSISFALSLMHNRSWRDDYDLTLAIYDAAAEIAYASGDFEDVERMVAEVLQGGRSFEDKLQANLTKMYALGSLDRTPEAIALGLGLLNQLGEKFPADPSPLRILYSFVKTRYLLNGKSDEVLLRLPTMTNTRAVSKMQIMNIVFGGAFVHKPMLAPLLAMRMVQLSVEHGLCAVSSVAFGVYGMLLVSKKMMVDEGTRMGDLSFKILDRFQAKAWIPRVHAAYYGHIHGWTRPHRTAFEPLLRGYRVGLETGDIEFAMINILIYLYFSFESGKPLKQLDEEYQQYIGAVAKKHKLPTILVISPLLSTVRFLIGGQSEVEHQPHDNKLNWAEGNRVILAVIFCDYKEAVRLGRVFQEYPYEGYDLALLYMLVGIANVALFKATGMRNPRLRIAARRCLMKINCVCPSGTDYCLAKLTLMQAEVSSLSPQRHAKTVRKYLIAIALADSSNNIFEKAVVHERYGRYLAERGDLSRSLSQLRLACSSYHEWNAYRKVELLQEEIGRISMA